MATLEGTIVSGHVRLDSPSSLPEGTRVRLLEAEDDWDPAWDRVPPPPPTETREEFLQSLRDSVAEARAGDHGMTVQEAFAKLDEVFFNGKRA